MKPLLRRLTSILVCAALVVPALLDAGCAANNSNASHVGQAISTLASAGVAVFESYDAARPIQQIQGTRSAMRLTRWQLSNMVAQADAHMGMLGSGIDKLERGKMPKNAPTFSYFIAAWIIRGEGPMALYARQLMGTQNYKHAPRINFPMLVITMFVADAARMRAGAPQTHPSTGFNFERMIATPAEAAGICSTVASFISQTVTDVENALSVQSTSFFATLWNVAIKLVAGIAEVVIAGVLYPLLSILNAVAGGLAALTAIASTLQPWTVAIESQPPSVTLGENAIDGKLVAVLNAPSIDWPSEVTDCAQVLTGVQLDKISYEDAPVTWETFGDVPSLASVTAKDAKIGNDKRASLTYATVTRDVSNALCASPQAAGSIGARASVERIDVVHAQEQLAKLAFAHLPPFVRNHLMPLFGPLLNQAEVGFAHLVSTPTEGSGTVEVFELKPDSKKCTPGPTVAPTATSEANTALIGAWACVVNRSVQTAIGPISVTVHTSYVFRKDGTATGSTAPNASWTSSHNVSAGNGAGGLGGSGPYTYTASGPENGTLNIDGADRQLTWSGPNAWSMPIHSAHFSGTLQCSRK